VRFGGGIGGGIAGGLIATLAIFLPSFLLIAVLGPLLPKIRANGIARGALNGMNAAVVALIFVVCVRLGVAALFDGMTVGVAVLTLAAVLIWNVNSTWLIVGSGLLGAARMMLH
jgi:chromate transporter